jgi:hypothetical protein
MKGTKSVKFAKLLSLYGNFWPTLDSINDSRNEEKASF